MRTTLDLNDGLLLRAKARAAEERRSLTSLIEEALRLQFDGNQTRARKVPVIPVFGGEGEMPGVDLANNKALLDLLEDEHGKS